MRYRNLRLILTLTLTPHRQKRIYVWDRGMPTAEYTSTESIAHANLPAPSHRLVAGHDRPAINCRVTPEASPRCGANEAKTAFSATSFDESNVELLSVYFRALYDFFENGRTLQESKLLQK